MIIIGAFIALVSLCCPFLIFLDYHKRGQIHLAVTYVIAFFTIIFLARLFIYNYGLILAGMVPFLILALCLIKNKH